MFSLGAARYYLYREPADMRKSFDGLCGLVTNHLHQNPSNGDVYIFLNKPRNRIKLLRCLHYRFLKAMQVQALLHTL